MGVFYTGGQRRWEASCERFQFIDSPSDRMLQGPSQRDPSHLKETRMGFTERPVNFPVTVAAPGKWKQLRRQRECGGWEEWGAAVTCAIASDQNPKRKQVSLSAAALQPPPSLMNAAIFWTRDPSPPRQRREIISGVSQGFLYPSWSEETIAWGLGGAAAVLIAGSHTKRNVSLQLHRRQRGVLICCVIVSERH